MSFARPVLALLAVLIGLDYASAQNRVVDPVKEPPRPEKVDVQIRYRIRADRDERVRQFLDLERFLTRLGFEDARKNDPDRDLDILDPTAERLTGTIPSKNVLTILDDPRVLSILFAPAGYAFPESRDNAVPIRIVIRGGLLPVQQQTLHSQTRDRLELLGFRDALGYDTRGYTQLKGTIPFKYLDRLVKDIRYEPSGWLLSDTPPDQLPRPFADRNPLKWVEVMPAAEQPPPLVLEKVGPAQAKLTPELRALIQNPAAKETPVRVLILFSAPIDDVVEVLRGRLIAEYGPAAKRDASGAVAKLPDGRVLLTEGASLDGVIGNMASIRFDRPADAERFAADPSVLSVRLPRQATETISPLPADIKAASAGEVLRASGVETFHRLGYTGAGVKVVLVGSDFTGADKLIGNGLPKNTRILDLTTELNPDIVPSPVDPNRRGIGTTSSLALALAAPDAELILVRIDPGAIFQLFEILRLVRGEGGYSEAMRSRLADINAKTLDLTRRKEAAITEYREAFADLADDEPSRDRRVKARAALDALVAEQNELVKRINRFNAFQKEVSEALIGSRVVVNTLVWESGYALDGMSLLSQTLEQMAVPHQPRVMRRAGDPASLQKPPLVWVQAASQSGAAVWGGPFLDRNRNGMMEFAPPNQLLPPSSWSPEMNFLGVQSATGQTTADLQAGAKLRFTMQWREPLDPNFPAIDQPVYPVILRVFRQLDPKGEKRPSDEMVEDGRTASGPYAILLTKTFVVYEQILDFTVPADGRYALVASVGDQPSPLLPALKREVEIHPRLIIETLSAKPGEPQVVFRSYVNPWAGVGIPGDSTGANTIGAVVPGQLFGGGTGITLRSKPDLFGPDTLSTNGPMGRGTGIATSYVGGMAVGLVQAGASGANPFQSSGFAPQRMAVIPESWMRYLRPIGRPEK